MGLLRSMGFCLGVLDHMRPFVGGLNFWLRQAGVRLFVLPGLVLRYGLSCAVTRLGLERACLFGD